MPLNPATTGNPADGLAWRDAEAIETELLRLLDASGVKHRIRPPASMMAHDLEGTIHVMDRPWPPAGDLARLDRPGAYVRNEAGAIIIAYAVGTAALWPHARFVVTANLVSGTTGA